MSNNDTLTQPDTTPQWVQVAVLGGDVQQLDFEDGMTVAEVLQAAQIESTQGSVVQVNGRAAAADEIVEPGSVVQVTSRVKNG